MKRLVFCLFFVVFVGNIQGSQLDSGYHSICLPGQNNAGGDSFRRNGVANGETHAMYSSLGYGHSFAERHLIDFGQKHCIRDFSEQFAADEDAGLGKVIVTAASQGTATVVNFLAQKSHAEQEAIAALVLEALLGSPHSAIMHTVSNVPLVTYLPFARLWIPLATKALAFRKYQFFGPQLIVSAKKISPNIVVVCMHDERDPQLSLDDAREGYIAFQSRANSQNNAYLMELRDPNGYLRHLDLLDGNPEQRAALQAIYKKHGLPFKECPDYDLDNIDLRPYQPSIAEVKKRIMQSSWKSLLARNVIDATTLALVASIALFKN